MKGNSTKCRRNIAANLNRLSRVYERYRRQTNGRATAYSEREREFTFAKNRWLHKKTKADKQLRVPEAVATWVPSSDIRNSNTTAIFVY